MPVSHPDAFDSSGHDGRQYFYLKYYVFNDFVEHGELPYWLPYVTHGAPATWWSVLQRGIFDPVMLGAARLLRLRDFYPIFYTLLFVEKMLLVGGTWLLASEHLRSRPAIFAVAAVARLTCAAEVKTSALDTARRCYVNPEGSRR